jgi:uncharacterized protein (TIGR00255 family)
MKSMTGFSYLEHQSEKHHVIINLKSYNNRFLDIVVYLPPFLTQLEQRLRHYLAERVNRGRVEVIIKVKEIEEEIAVKLDKEIIITYVTALKELAKEAGVHEKITLSHLLRIEGILKPKKSYNIEQYWKSLEPLLNTTFEEFDAARNIEGKRTEEFIKTILKKINTNVNLIDKRIPEIEEKIKEMLRNKFYELLGNEIDEGRVLSETALLLIKFDIKEEISRMKSHLKSFSVIIKESGTIGKKLDFICQELNREINTIGSKSIFLDVNNAVIAIKDAIETIRELLRNVE